jgi:hypothetical protein
MQVTINIEAPSAAAVVESLSAIDCVHSVVAREDEVTYSGPDGPVTTTVVIAQFEWRHRASPAEALTLLADEFDQDSLAAQWEDTADLFGPRRDRWLPFNTAYFIHF